jgi:hypothetical protein
VNAFPQGAWYVLSALGLYVTTPGTTEYVLGSPVFRHVRISRSPETYDAYYEASYEQRSAAADSGNKYSVHPNFGCAFVAQLVSCEQIARDGA